LIRVGQRASFGFKHHRNAVPNRESKLINPAHELGVLWIGVKAALA
jgi:hypothetical protein